MDSRLCRFDETHKPMDLRNSTNPNQDKHKTIPKFNKIKNLKNSDLKNL